MTIYQVHGALGGCGASAVAWTIAEQTGATAAFDMSSHQGGLGWCASGDVDTSWPRILAAEIDQHRLLEIARQVGSVRLCSGGVLPPTGALWPVIAAVARADSVVVDGGEIFCDAVQVFVMPNQLRAMRRLKHVEGFVLCGVHKDGVPPKLVQQALPRAELIFFDYESTVRRSLQLGYPLPRKSQMRKAVDKWLKAIAPDGD